MVRFENGPDGQMRAVAEPPPLPDPRGVRGLDHAPRPSGSAWALRQRALVRETVVKGFHSADAAVVYLKALDRLVGPAEDLTQAIADAERVRAFLDGHNRTVLAEDP